MTVVEAQEIFVRALCIWREFRGESQIARLAGYWVIQNRMTDVRARWPRTAYGVCTQPYQFSCFSVGNPEVAALPRPDHVFDWQAWQEICALCDAPEPDPTDGANAYEALAEGAAKPGWAERSRVVKQIGKTRYYRL